MSDENGGFKKVLNKRDILALAVGAEIGWSWVILSGFWLNLGGTLGAMLAFIIGGVLVIFVGLAYAELTVAMPQVGGGMVFCMRAMGKPGSFVSSWSIILGYVGVVAFESCAFPTVIQYIAPEIMKKGYMYTIAGFDVYMSWVAVGVVLSIIITAINYRGVKSAAIFNTILTCVIGGVGIALIAGSVVKGDIETAKPFFESGFKGVLRVAVMTPFMFVGFDVIPQAVEEIDLPVKKIGSMMILSIVIAVIFYVGVIMGVSLMMSKPELEVSTMPTAEAMKKIFFNLDAAATVLIIGGVAGIVTSWNGFFVGGSRAIYAMADAKMLPSFLGKIHPRYQTPGPVIILIGLISCIAPFFGRQMLVWLIDAGGFSTVITYLLVSISFLILRKTEPEMERPYRVKNGVPIGYTAAVLCIFMIILYMPGMSSGLAPVEFVLIGIWALLGAVFGITAKLKYGKGFGESEKLIQPIRIRNAK
ncbi:amino acid permease [Spirochaetia bacterium]|nr:amino acid permease [Spirochaetia bacterium]